MQSEMRSEVYFIILGFLLVAILLVFFFYAQTNINTTLSPEPRELMECISADVELLHKISEKEMQKYLAEDEAKKDKFVDLYRRLELNMAFSNPRTGGKEEQVLASLRTIINDLSKIVEGMGQDNPDKELKEKIKRYLDLVKKILDNIEALDEKDF